MYSGGWLRRRGSRRRTSFDGRRMAGPFPFRFLGGRLHGGRIGFRDNGCFCRRVRREKIRCCDEKPFRNRALSAETGGTTRCRWKGAFPSTARSGRSTAGCPSFPGCGRPVRQSRGGRMPRPGASAKGRTGPDSVAGRLRLRRGGRGICAAAEKGETHGRVSGAHGLPGRSVCPLFPACGNRRSSSCADRPGTARLPGRFGPEISSDFAGATGTGICLIRCKTLSLGRFSACGIFLRFACGRIPPTSEPTGGKRGPERAAKAPGDGTNDRQNRL